MKNMRKVQKKYEDGIYIGIHKECEENTKNVRSSKNVRNGTNRFKVSLCL